MLALLASIVLGSGGQGADKSLIDTIFPNPSGRNGYEDYVRACDALGPQFPSGMRLFDNYRHWHPAFYEDLASEAERMATELPSSDLSRFKFLPTSAQIEHAKRLDSMTRLEVQRELVQRYRPAIELVRTGMSKALHSPPRKWSLDGWIPEEHFPEMGELEDLAAILNSAATVSFADGRPSDAARFVSDEIKFANSIRTIGWRHKDVAMKVYGSALQTLDQNLTLIPLADCRELKRLAEVSIWSDEEILRTVENVVHEGVRWIIGGFLDLQFFQKREELDAEQRKLVQEARSLTPAKRNELENQIRSAIPSVIGRVLAEVRTPESQWQYEEMETEGDISDAKSLDETIAMFRSMMLRSVGSTPLVDFAVMRCQFRLLALHCAVLEYRWENGKLPESLDKVATKQEIFDPLSGGEFVYAYDGRHGFQIVSRGSEHTGTIELKGKVAQ